MNLAEVRAYLVKLSLFIDTLTKIEADEEGTDDLFTLDHRQEAQTLIEEGDVLADQWDEMLDDLEEREAWGVTAQQDEGEWEGDAEGSDWFEQIDGDVLDRGMRSVFEEMADERYKDQELTRPLEEVLGRLDALEEFLKECEDYLSSNESPA